MVGGRRVDPGAHGLQGAGECAAGELESSVRDHVGRDAESADPVVEEGAGDGVGVDGGEWDGLEPPRRPVHHGQHVPHAFRWWQGTHYVHVKVLESPVRYRVRFCFWYVLSFWFDGLTRVARFYVI